MMFSLKLFIKSGFLKAIGDMADYKIILNAAAWLDKGVLDESDLAEIQAAIEAHNVQKEPTDETEESNVDSNDAQIDEQDQTI